MHSAGHGKDSYDLEFSNSRHGSFIGKSRKPTCSTWQSSAWRSQSQSQTSCWIYWQRDCLPRSACTDLWGGAEELRFFLHNLLPENCDKLVYENSILEDSQVLSFEAHSEVQICAICKARRAALSSLSDLFRCRFHFRAFLDEDDWGRPVLGLHDPSWLEAWLEPPIHFRSEMLRINVRDFLFSEQQYWDALWQQQIGFPQEQEQELVSWFLHGYRQCHGHMFPVPSAMKGHAMKATAMKRMPMAWNDGRRGNRVRTSGKRM